MQIRTKTVAILIDGSNLHAANKALGFTVDYAKLKDFFKGDILRAVYFTALPPNGAESSLKPLADYLDYNGWSVVTKDTKEFIDPITNIKKVKGNMDVEIAVIAMELAPYITDLVLFTGDGDFRFLVETVQRKHAVKVTVVSTIKSRPAMIADELRRQADVFIDLVELQPHIKRTTTTPVDDAQEPNLVRRRKFSFGS